MLLIHLLTLFVRDCFWSLSRYAMLSVLSSFAIILIRERERERERLGRLIYLICLPDVLSLLVFFGPSVGRSAACDCGISCPYSLANRNIVFFFNYNLHTPKRAK